MRPRHRHARQPDPAQPLWRALSFVAEWALVASLFAAAWASNLLPRRLRIRLVRRMDDTHLRRERERHEAKYGTPSQP